MWCFLYVFEPFRLGPLDDICTKTASHSELVLSYSMLTIYALMPSSRYPSFSAIFSSTFILLTYFFCSSPAYLDNYLSSFCSWSCFLGCYWWPRLLKQVCLARYFFEFLSGEFQHWWRFQWVFLMTPFLCVEFPQWGWVVFCWARVFRGETCVSVSSIFDTSLLDWPNFCRILEAMLRILFFRLYI